MTKPNTEEFGWTAVPRNRSNIPSEQEAKAPSVEVEFGTIWPQTQLIVSATKYAKVNLPQETFNHSLRVYCYGRIDAFSSLCLLMRQKAIPL